MILWVGLGSMAPAAAQVQELTPPPVSTRNAGAPPGDVASPGYLGAILDDRNDRGRGVRIVNVLKSGPAAQAGLASGDLVTQIDGDTIGSMQDFLAQMRGRTADTRVAFTIERNAVVFEIGVALGTRPPPQRGPLAGFGRIDDAARMPIDETTGARPGRLGVVVVPVNEDVRRRLHLPDHRGAVVTSVAKGSPAERAGLPIAATIVAVDTDPVDGPLDLLRLISDPDSPRTVILAYLIGSRLHECKVTLERIGDATVDVESQSTLPLNIETPPPNDEIDALKRRVRELEAVIRRLKP